MKRLVTAEYDAERNELRLTEPLEGVKDGEKVDVMIVALPHGSEPSRPWLALSGIMSKEQGEDFARALAELEDD